MFTFLPRFHHSGTARLFVLCSVMAFVFVACSPAMQPESATDSSAQQTFVPATEVSGYVSFAQKSGWFRMADANGTVPVLLSDSDDAGVLRAARDLGEDVQRVTGHLPEVHQLSDEEIPGGERVIIAGTMGESPLIDRLVSSGHIPAEELTGKWETFRMEVVQQPLEGVEEALIIVGSDPRGTIYGLYELSEQIGVSPWFWWADVPVPHQEEIYVNPRPHSLGVPKVKYRGIFINNENPGLLGWVNETYGGFGHEFYTQVFELILRQKGNYLWPAMWGKAFHDDDPENARLADEYGVVIGYSHHEPMVRAHIEWERYGEGPWDYEANTETLQEFWREGIRRMKDYETSVSLGMRGDGDEPMSDDANIELLERIVADQRQIIRETAEEDIDDIIQVWALYKEVQDYYEQGMDVPDDVLILLANDNWGNVRLLPDPQEAAQREGGWGMYYHFDYVGGPRTYKWINTTQISRIWEQMSITYAHNVNELWLVNVGDIKPHEFPISFFLDYAWNPEAVSRDDLQAYSTNWAGQQFGAEFAEEIGALLDDYTRFNARRKPELLDEQTYSLHQFREFERVVDDFNALADRAEALRERLPEGYDDAYYQLVLYPILAAANLNELYLNVARNHHYAEQGRAAASVAASRVRELFARDAELTRYYNQDMSDGKWPYMVDQPRIGYTNWAQPQENIMPELREPELRTEAQMGVSVEGRTEWWPLSASHARLPEFDRFARQAYSIEIFNRGQQSFAFEAGSDADWIQLSAREGRITTQEQIMVHIDWERAPEGRSVGEILIQQTEGEQAQVRVQVPVFNSAEESGISGFVETNGYIAMEAADYARNIPAAPVQRNGALRWQEIPGLGRTASGMTPRPVVAHARTPGTSDSPRLEYDVHLFSPGEITVKLYLSPTLNYQRKDGHRFGIGFNDETPSILNMHEELEPGYDTGIWNDWVGDNINVVESTHTLSEAGAHTLKLWMMDPGVVVQRVVILTDRFEQEFGPDETYLGPPVTPHLPE